MVIPLRAVGTPVQRQPEPHRLFILSSLLFGVFGGFMLALLVPLARALGWGWENSRPDLVHVHGQLQVVGFGGLFVMGMALRLLPRFSRSELRFPAFIVPMWGLIVGALALRSLVVIWLPDALHGPFVAGFQAVVLVAALLFAAVVLGTLTRPNQGDATSWFFAAGAAFYLLQGLAGFAIAMNELGDTTRVFSYLPNTALLYLQTVGFVLAFIGGVGTRAIPTMVGLERPVRAGMAVAVLLSLSVVVLAAALLWAEYDAPQAAAARVAGGALAALGLAFLGIVWLTGVFRPVADRLRPASRPHLWLVRSAFGWLAFAAGLALYFGFEGLREAALPDPLAVDALRHTLAVGVITTLIMGMAQMIVPEFAGERFPGVGTGQARRAYTLALLLAAATVLRVLPALAGLDWAAETRAWTMAAAGLCAETAIIIFAWSFVRLAFPGRAA